MNRFVCLRKMLFAAMAFIALSGCAEKAVQEDKAGCLQISPSVAFAPRDNVAGVVDNSMIESLTFTFARVTPDGGGRVIHIQRRRFRLPVFFPSAKQARPRLFLTLCNITIRTGAIQ